MTERCPWAIRYGTTLVTRCFLDEGHDSHHPHRGRGVRDSATVISWAVGDRREFQTNRDDAWTWQVASHREQRKGER